MNEFLIGMVVALVVVGGLWFWLKLKKNRPAKEIRIFSSIERLRAIGQLSVYKVLTKEIVTETDHTWGEFGNRYLGWVLSRKKMAMIFEFEIDFRFNLQSPLFEIKETGEAAYSITMPPCDYEVHIRDIRFYDEQGSKLLPWLLPDLLNGFISDGFSEDDKNKLVDAAKGHAEKQALELINNIQSEVQKSAKTTLESISRAFGAESVEFSFSTPTAIEVEVAVSEKLAASA
ncbi:DUF4230 domain-containing protein [Pontiella sulfatireligans]|uniref:DUF4230 domain-containing protein n=1 Tax=Pontiella sulfatireligans TaxID=2750658 RepID=A0A6C2UKZ9_9BACT|nr:DUF4230 domain-containing protein [Pontiella sulfatireligans]VGO20900.1 hypothetical protein SCARR_02967 [Pontiella sulfatireligans]